MISMRSFHGLQYRPIQVSLTILQGFRALEIWAPRMNNQIDNLGIY